MGSLGSILGSISPAAGMVSGKGLFGNKDVMGTLSPMFGMISGKGLGGQLGGMGGMGGLGLLGMLLGGKHGGGQTTGEDDSPTAPAPSGNRDPKDFLSQMLMHLMGGAGGGGY